MDVKKVLKEHEQELKARFGVKRMGLFGSCARGEQTATSDVDMVVEFETSSFDNFMDLTFYLEELFGRKVDILTPAGIKSIRFKEVAENITRSVVYV
ncbi:MAG: nucleotidyltransferase family protein [Thermoplasmata archaeon]|nr:nucleotidyltransferase family protein [Thermoplasmata archaeon]